MREITVNHCKQAVVRTDEVVPSSFDENRPARRPDARVDDTDVNCSFREVAPRLGHQECALCDFVRRHLMADVDNLRRRDIPDDSLITPAK